PVWPARRVLGARIRLFLAHAHAARAVPARLPRVSVHLRRVPELLPEGGGPRRLLRGLRQFRQAEQRPDLLAGGPEHDHLHRGGHHPEGQRRARHGARDEPELQDEVHRPRHATPPVHRAHRAQHRGLAVDPRPRHGPLQSPPRGERARLLAGLQTIPVELHESATIDGAGMWGRFRYVTLPSLMPVILIVTVFSIVITFFDFQLVYVLTGGGPANSTHLMATYAYSLSMGAGQMGLGSAVALSMVPVLGLLLVALTFYVPQD